MKQFDRSGLLEELNNQHEWDVLVIGGGATGLGVAVDAATRGYRTLLVEQDDFAKGTSSRSTKLVHGGVRYLAQGNVSLVREALKERGLLLKNAPHLTKNESFIIPCYSWFRGVFYGVGLKMYDWLSGRLSLGKSKIIDKKGVLERLPEIKSDRLKCGVLYHDGAFDDARLALNLAQTCIDNGGVAINYCKVVELTKNDEGRVNGAVIIDAETGKSYQAEAKAVVNATGVFVDDILKMATPGKDSMIRPSQGVHLVLDRSFLKSRDAIMIPHTDDGRVLFVIPWYEKVLVGTTDTPLESHSLEPRALEKEVEFILYTAGKYLNRQPERSDVLSVFAGLRPLAATSNGNEKTKEISRSHKVIVGKNGMISIIGGKWTTYRKMAEDALSAAIQHKMLPAEKCVTEHLRIHNYKEGAHVDKFSVYGSDGEQIKKMIEDDPSLGVPFLDDDGICAAQVIWAVRKELARTVEDVLARRVRVLFTDAQKAIDVAPDVAEIMMKELGRDEEWRDNQIETFTKLAEGYLLNRTADKSLSLNKTV